jgi:cation transport ATPase
MHELVSHSSFKQEGEFMSFWTAAVIIVALGVLGKIFTARLKTTADKSEASVKNLAQRVTRLEDRIGNLETIVVDEERTQKFSAL